jgi:hypothetical protein
MREMRTDDARVWNDATSTESGGSPVVLSLRCCGADPAARPTILPEALFVSAEKRPQIEVLIGREDSLVELAASWWIDASS